MPPKRLPRTPSRAFRRGCGNTGIKFGGSSFPRQPIPFITPYIYPPRAKVVSKNAANTAQDGPKAETPRAPLPPIVNLSARVGAKGVCKNVRGPFGQYGSYLGTFDVAGKSETWNLRSMYLDSDQKIPLAHGHTYSVVTGFVQEGEFKGKPYFRLREVTA